MKKKVDSSKNCPNWVANENDYELVFMDVDGEFREVGHNIAKFNNMLFVDYMLLMNIDYIPDYCQFMRILHPDYMLEYRAFGGRIRIDYTKREFDSKII